MLEVGRTVGGADWVGEMEHFVLDICYVILDMPLEVPGRQL